MTEKDYMYCHHQFYDDYPFEEDFGYTIEYVTSDGEVMLHHVKKPNKRRKLEPELDIGDTTAIDSFLGGFCCGSK